MRITLHRLNGMYFLRLQKIGSILLGCNNFTVRSHADIVKSPIPVNQKSDPRIRGVPTPASYNMHDLAVRYTTDVRLF